MGGRGPVLRRKAGAGAGRRPVHRRRGGLRAGQAAHAQRHPHHALLSGPPGRLPVRLRGDRGPGDPRLSARLPRPRRDPHADRPAGHVARGLSRHGARPLRQPGRQGPAPAHHLGRRLEDPRLHRRDAAAPASSATATSGGSPSCSRPSPTIWAAATTAAPRSRRSSRIWRPPIWRWRRMPIPRPSCGSPTSRASGLAQATGFAASVRDYRARIAADGALATLAAMHAEGA